MQKLTKNLIIAGVVVVIIVVAGLIFWYFSSTKPVSLYDAEAKNGNITKKVNLTGQVKASQGVDLAFEVSGKIVANYVKVGDKIYTGERLVAIDSSLLQAQLQQAQAQLDALDINTLQNKLNVSTQTLYATSLSAAQKSVSTAKDILLTLSDIQYNHFTSQIQQNINFQNVKATAVNSLLGQNGAGLWTSQALGQLNGGAFGQVQNAVSNPTPSNIESALSATASALQDVNSFVNAMPIDPSLTPTERTNLSMAKTNINPEIITTSANIQAIASAKVNNSATISTTNDQISAAQAQVQGIKDQVSKTVLRALFNGQVDKNNVVVGSIASPNVPVITISNSNLEIDTYIPEVDIANAKIGDDADVTLDAYGNSVNFPSKVVSIDSAPSSVSGISAYGAKLKFDNPDDRIKSGMTANISVVSGTHSDVLLVPVTAVLQKNGQYFVIVDKGNNQKEVRQVTVGLKDSQNIEIISGLKLGEKVLAY